MIHEELLPGPVGGGNFQRSTYWRGGKAYRVLAGPIGSDPELHLRGGSHIHAQPDPGFVLPKEYREHLRKTVDWTLPDGHYHGQATHGHADGQGHRTFADGKSLDGTFARGQAVHGKSTYSDGATYDGDLKDGYRNGNGKLVLPSGTTCDCAFANGEATTGTATYPNRRQIYRQLQGGTVVRRLRHTCFGGVVGGHYVDGHLVGPGWMNMPGVGRYDGDFKNGLPDGKGKFILKDGSSYEGDFVSGRPRGHGTFRWATGEKWEATSTNMVPFVAGAGLR